jgi:hypothetical protein
MNRLKKLFNTTVYVEFDVLTGALVFALTTLGATALVSILIDTLIGG